MSGETERSHGLDPQALLEGKYRIVRSLAHGGMGDVHEALHVGINRHVAIKLLHPDIAADPQALGRFYREARAAGTIGHDNICEVLDAGQTPTGLPFLVMPLLHGTTLRELIAATGPLPVPRAVDIAAQTLAGLGAAHAAGIVHRDLKPDNLFLVRMGDRDDFVKILDFGISKPLHDLDAKLTQTGTVIGTPYYMAPEQARALPDLDERVDLYAMGIILFEMLTGALPFQGPSFSAIISAILLDPFPSVRSLRADVPEALEAVLLRATARDREARPRTAADLRSALLAACPSARASSASGAVSARPVATPWPSTTAAAPTPSPRIGPVAPSLAGPSPAGSMTPPGTAPSGMPPAGPPPGGSPFGPPPGFPPFGPPPSSGASRTFVAAAAAVLLAVVGAVAYFALGRDDGSAPAPDAARGSNKVVSLSGSSAADAGESSLAAYGGKVIDGVPSLPPIPGSGLKPAVPGGPDGGAWLPAADAGPAPVAGGRDGLTEAPPVPPRPPGPPVPAPPSTPEPELRDVRVDSWNPVVGPPDAPVTLVVFGEYLCPFCKRLEGTLQTLRTGYAGRIRIVYRNFVVHPGADQFALAALAAARQGKFGDLHESLMAHQEELRDPATLDLLAMQAGLNVTRLHRDMERPELARQLEADQTEGRRVGVSGTPSTFINGRMLSGAQSVERFRELIDAALVHPSSPAPVAVP